MARMRVENEGKGGVGEKGEERERGEKEEKREKGEKGEKGSGGGEIVVRLSPRERLAARRGAVRVPLTALRAAYVEPDWWRALRGAKGKGLWIPDRLCVGTRILPDGEDFVVIHPGRPVLCVELRGSAPYRRLAVSDPEPEQALSALMPYVPVDRLDPEPG
ncbi:hypothetical protein ACIGEZ_26205 [Streptomyces sp. NPDC085481]|uniref:hypothetical protein n=1 Tax=Streptomyces sp. NPDC085481 TaxID=3365727 RepID=UPI0037D1CC9A